MFNRLFMFFQNSPSISAKLRQTLHPSPPNSPSPPDSRYVGVKRGNGGYKNAGGCDSQWLNCATSTV